MKTIVCAVALAVVLGLGGCAADSAPSSTTQATGTSRPNGAASNLGTTGGVGDRPLGGSLGGVHP